MASSDDLAVGDGNDHVELQVDGVAMVRLLGPQDRLLTTIERQYPEVDLLVRGNVITLSGDAVQVQAARELVQELIRMVRSGVDIGPVEISSSARMLDAGSGSPA